MKLTKIIATALLTVSVAQVYAACTPPGTLVDEWADPKDPEWTIGLNWINRTTYLWCDPVSNRDIYVEGPRKIDGCDAGLVLYKGWYVCKNKLPPPPPPPPPPPAPIYPPAGTVCKPDYPKPEFEDCAPGYRSGNTGTHDGDTWCKMTAAQKQLCTVIYPPAPPDPGEPTSGPGWQGGYLGQDGQMYNDPNGESLCGSCDRVIGHVEQETRNEESTQPDPNSNEGDTGGDTGGE